MSFTPLPTNLLDRLAVLDPHTDSVLELGSGEGHLTGLIAARTGRCLGLDRRHPVTGVVCDLVGDARNIPVRAGSLAVVVAANLVRHLVPRQQLGPWVAEWRGLLKPGGVLYILEDDPDPVVAAQRNFRDFQRFLARLLPESRGPLLDLGRFRALIQAEAEDSGWTFGHQANDEEVDTAAVLELINGGMGRVSGMEAALSRAIASHGIRPGRYWWACAGPLARKAEK